MKTNKDRLVMQSVQGSISSPKSGGYRVDRDGMAQILPATGGITYNVQVGDSAFGWVGDHIEPGVSMKAEDNKQNMGLAFLACIGNKAVVTSGDAKGAKGYVTGMHGGINHILLYFEQDELNKMTIGDNILIKAYGQGLRLTDYPNLKCFNLDPDLLDKMELKADNGQLEVLVTAKIPGHLMGSGIGASTAATGDYDITTGDEEEIKKLGLDRLRLGDIVYLEDCDNTFGREYRKGAGSIGIVIHSDCIKMGHGPGITTLMTSKQAIIKPVISEEANIVKYI